MMRLGKSSLKLKILFAVFATILVYLVNHFGLLLHLFEISYDNFSYPLDIPIDDVLRALKKGEKPAHKPINEFRYPYRISNHKKCLEGNNNSYEKIVILYVIKSALPNHKQRDAIRKSWGWENRFSDVSIRRIFLSGVSPDSSLLDSLDEEYARHRDIVQGDFVDSYYNNTIKTMLGFKWVIEHCPEAQFIFFADDDMYVSTKNLLKFIRNPFNERLGYRRKRDLSPTNPKMDHQSAAFDSRKLFELNSALRSFDGRLMAGYVFFSSPMRHKSSKWFMPLDQYPYSKYPPYVTAGAYVLSFSALKDLYYTSLYTKPFKFDDVYLGIVAKKCGIVPLHNENFHFWRKAYDRDGYGSVIASHGFGDPDELKKVWDEQRSAGHA